MLSLETFSKRHVQCLSWRSNHRWETAQRGNSHSTLREPFSHPNLRVQVKQKHCFSYRTDKKNHQVHSPAQQERTFQLCSHLQWKTLAGPRPQPFFSEALRVPTLGSANASSTVPVVLPHGFRSVAHYPDRGTRFRFAFASLTFHKVLVLRLFVVQLSPLPSLDAPCGWLACLSSFTSSGPLPLSLTTVVPIAQPTFFTSSKCQFFRPYKDCCFWARFAERGPDYREPHRVLFQVTDVHRPMVTIRIPVFPPTLSVPLPSSSSANLHHC